MHIHWESYAVALFAALGAACAACNGDDTSTPDASATDASAHDATLDTTTNDAPGGGDASDAAADSADAGALDASDGSCPSSWTTAPTVDPSIAVPADGGSVILHAAATGTQDYTCMGTDAGADAALAYAWTFVGPEATLADCNGKTIGMHSAPTGAASPQWTNEDGSIVVGHKVAAFTHDANAIPWLLLSAASHTGTGVMSRVQFVQRVNTTNGIAPTTACDSQTAGASQKVGYAADYFFFGQ
jgi:hypothetical protein